MFNTFNNELKTMNNNISHSIKLTEDSYVNIYSNGKIEYINVNNTDEISKKFWEDLQQYFPDKIYEENVKLKSLILYIINILKNKNYNDIGNEIENIFKGITNT